MEIVTGILNVFNLDADNNLRFRRQILPRRDILLGKDAEKAAEITGGKIVGKIVESGIRVRDLVIE